MTELAARPPLPAHSAPPWRRWVPWLLGSLLLHAAALVAMQPTPSVLRLSAPAAPVAVRLSAPQAARPAAMPPALATEPAPPRPAPGPQTETQSAPDAAPPQANSSPPEAFASPLPEAGSPGAELLPVPFAPSAQWPYELLFEGERGDALLDWQREGLGYTLQLERRTSRRTLPTWRSTGTVSPTGLAPTGFASRNARRQGPRFDIDQAALTVIGPSGTLPVPRGVQDRLSWMLQLSATLAAQPAARAIELTVVDWRGRPQPWRLDWVADTTVRLSDGAERAAQHWRRQEMGAAQAEIELWLDPELGHLPLRIVHSVRGDDRWELQLSPSAVPKLETLPQVRTERDQSPTPGGR